MLKLKLFFAIAGLTVVCFIVGLYFGGWVWLKLNGHSAPLPSLFTLIDQGNLSLTNKSKMLLPWAWCATVAITFLPTGITLLAFMGRGDGNPRNLHGNARFANRRELRNIWYTEPEKNERK